MQWFLKTVPPIPREEKQNQERQRWKLLSIYNDQLPYKNLLQTLLLVPLSLVGRTIYYNATHHTIYLLLPNKLRGEEQVRAIRRWGMLKMIAMYSSLIKSAPYYIVKIIVGNNIVTLFHHVITLHYCKILSK